MSYTKMESDLYESSTYQNFNGREYFVIEILDAERKAAFIKDVKSGEYYVAIGMEKYLRTDEKGSKIAGEWSHSYDYGKTHYRTLISQRYT